MSFSALKKNSTNSIENLTKYIDSKKNQFGPDPRYWTLSVDKAGNGYAVIRFLPAVEGEEYPYVDYYSHGFKGPTGKWYIENSLTTIGKPDPLSELNSEDYNSGDDRRKKLAESRARTLSYVSNILVISDPANKENEGKVFLYRYGKKLFEKIQSAMKPAFPDEKPFNPFDFWQGANFKLKAYNNEGNQRQYDRSAFDTPSPLMNGDDEALEKLWKMQYPLLPEVAADKFKSYEELKTKLYDVLGISASGQVAVNQAQHQQRERDEPATVQSNRQVETRAVSHSTPSAPVSSGVEDDDYAAYADLLKD